MSLTVILDVGLDVALDLSPLGFLAKRRLLKATDALKSHFTLSSKDLALAFQGALGRSGISIAVGVAPDDWLAPLRAMSDKVFVNLLNREFAAGIAPTYFDPFVRVRGVERAALAAVRRDIAAVARAIAKHRDRILPAEAFPEPDLAALLQQSRQGDVTDLVLERCRSVVPDLSDEAAAFLRHDGLLGNAVLFFFREALRRDQRVRTTLSVLQQQGLWADVREGNAAQAALAQRLEDHIAELGGRIERAQSEMQAHLTANRFTELAPLAETVTGLQAELQASRDDLAALPEAFAALADRQAAMNSRLDGFAGQLGAVEELMATGHDRIESALDALGAQLTAEIRTVGQSVETLVEAEAAQSDLLRELVAMMQRLELSARVRPVDRFTVQPDPVVGMIRQTAAAVRRSRSGRPLPTATAITLASALVSSGDLDEADTLLQEAIDTASDPSRRALAAHNLFQVRVHKEDHAAALDPLQLAIRLDPDRYAPHDIAKYPIRRILGAGGAGCAFLCDEPMMHRQVVVKAFWESTPGPMDEVFAEVSAIAKVGGDRIPAPLAYDFARATGRPYWVMPYLAGYRDGDAWLKDHGPLGIERGVAVGALVAETLATAHEAGVVHLDLKPGNLLLAERDGDIDVKVIDFGLARVARSLAGQAPSVTRATPDPRPPMVTGTWDYAPPEQRGETGYGPPGPKSDVYGLGVALFRLITGRRAAALHNWRGLAPPAALRDLLEACTDDDPQDRPDAAELLHRLSALAAKSRHSAPSAEPPGDPDMPKGYDPEYRVALARGPFETVDEFAARLADRPVPVGTAHLDAQRYVIETGRFSLELDWTLEGLSPPKQAWIVVPRDTAKALFQEGPEKLVFAHLALVNSAPAVTKLELVGLNQVLPVERRDFEIIEGRWGETGCVFRDLAIDGRSDPTLPQMVVIPAGRFTMGSPSDEPERYDDEGPQHEVVISRPFALGRYAVTQAEWTAVMGDNPSHFEGDRNPVEQVSWDDVKVFIAKLNAKLGLSEQAGYRLPSEAEWEYACRAGTTTPFWWGSTITTNQANYNGNSTYNNGKKGQYREKTVPVDGFEPNRWGLYQVHGNVREWCEDSWNDSYNGAPNDGTSWTAGNSKARVLRGGSWNLNPDGVRSAYRLGNAADSRNDDVGFRLARTFPHAS